MLKIRSSKGCWTCRLRRKKCDERKPVCSICAALEITCQYSETKPDWMDGGAREKAKADELKAMVKAKANERRERKWALGFLDADEVGAWAGAGIAAAASSVSSSSDPADHFLSHSMASHMVLDDANSPENDTNTSAASTSHTPATSVMDDFDNRSTSLRRPSAGEFLFPSGEMEHGLNLISMYMDYVFPFLMPFYRPPILEGGRGWLLVLLMKNKALHHTANSVASYFFSVVLDYTLEGHEECRMANWNELQRQQDLAIKELRLDMQAVNEAGVAGSFDSSLRCLESILQMLIFETSIANTENWQVHLDAASVLFEQLVECHAITDAARPFRSLLSQLNQQALEVSLNNGRHPWSGEQGALRFFTMDLLWKDIIASAALGRAPRLQRFHPELFEGDSPELCSEDFIGCQNFALLSIGHIAALDAWKKEMRSSGALDVAELGRRGACIEALLRAGIAKLSAVPMDLSEDAFGPYPGVSSTFTPQNWKAGPNPQRRISPAQALDTKIWAQAALIYLAVVVSGFRPAHPDVQAHVVAAMEMLRMTPSPLCLRTVVWPFAITGCLALPCQEAFFRDFVASMGPISVFGSVKEALDVMSAVWSQRDRLDWETWDISACLGVLGHKSLLV